MCTADLPVGMVFAARRNIYLDTQHPQGWEKIQSLEQRPKYERIEVADAPLLAPRFTSELRVSFTELFVLFLFFYTVTLFLSIVFSIQESAERKEFNDCVYYMYLIL